MINQPELENIDSSMTSPPKDVLSYSVSQNPVASELDGDSIDSSIQNALTETASNQSKKTPISIPVQELTPIERAVNEYAQINNARNKTALNQSLVSASAKDPDTAAKSQALATSLKVSTGVVDFDIELAKRQMLLRQAEAMKLAEKYPSLARSFLDQDFAAIAHDDIDNLAKTSDISRRLIATEKSPSDSLPLEFDPIRTANYYATNTLEGFKFDWERGYKSGNITDRSSKLGYSAFTSPGSELRDLYIFQAENLKSKTEEYLGTWTESLAELAGQMAPMTVEATATGVVASGAAALVASIFPPAELPAAPGAFAVGFAGSMSYQSFEIETGASYLDLRKGDEDYEPMSHEEAAAIAPTIGLINAVLETASNFFFFIPGAKLANYALKKTVKETVSKSLRKATVGKLARSAAVRVLKTGTLETVTEVLQTIVPKIVQEANVPEGRMSAFDTEEGRKRFADEIAVTIEKTFKGAFLLGLIPGGAKFIHERSIFNKSIEQQNDITNLIDNAKKSKVNKRSKPTYNSYLAQQLSGESLHIGVDQFEQIRKKSGVSLEELEKIIPGITEQVAKAKASGGDVVIPTSLYLSELIDTEFGVSIRNDIRADAEGKSINDIAEDEISRKDFLKELKQEIEDFKKTNKDWAESAGNIEEEMFAKIKAAGNYTEEEARMLAQFHRDIAVVLASRFKMTPEQFNAKFGLSIESAYTPEQQAPAQQVAPTINELEKFLTVEDRQELSVLEKQRTEDDGGTLSDRSKLAIQDRKSDLIQQRKLEQDRPEIMKSLLEENAGKESDITSMVRRFLSATGTAVGNIAVAFDMGLISDLELAVIIKRLEAITDKESSAEFRKWAFSHKNKEIGKAFGELPMADEMNEHPKTASQFIAKLIPETIAQNKLDREAQAKAREAKQAPAQGSFEQASRANLGLGQQAAFNEANYRPTIVAWAKEKFGDRTAPDGSTVWQNFTEWFGDSKVVDAEGKPMVVYHGTKKTFQTFKSTDPNGLIYFSVDLKFSEKYASKSGGFRKPEADIQQRIDNARIAQKEITTPLYEELKSKYANLNDIPSEEYVAILEKGREVERSLLDGMTAAEADMRMGVRVIDTYIRASNIFDPATMWEEFLPVITEVLARTGETPISNSMMEYIKNGHYLIWENKDVVDAVFQKYDAIKLRESMITSGVDTIAVRDPSQVKSASANTGEFSATDPNILRQEAVPATFYSALGVEVNKLTTKSAIADSWKQQIKGLIAKGVIKEREVFWSGLNNWLDLQEGKITKEQVQAFLAAGGVKVETETLGNQLTLSLAAANIQRTLENAQFGLESYRQPIFDVDAQYALASWQKPGISEKLRLQYEALLNEKLNDAGDHRTVSDYVSDVSETKYQKYQLPGGTNYREVLITLPSNMAPIEMQTVYHLFENGELVSSGDETSQAKWLSQNPSADIRTIKRETQDSRAKRQKAGKFISSHWDQPNVLVHLRLNDRVDADGKKVLFVEEVQSDWGQQGREKGFVNLTWKAALEKEGIKLVKESALKRDNALQALGSWRNEKWEGRPTPVMLDMIVSMSHLGVEWASRFGIESDSDIAIINDYIQTAKRSVAVDRQLTEMDSHIPVAPFVETTSGWLELGLKQIMLEAVNGKYDRVAFVDGDQSVDRYRKALTEAVDEVEINKNDDGTYTYSAIRGGVTVQGEQLVSAKRINEVFGKAGSKQLLEQADANPNDIHTISSKDIEIGGEGMRKFYDTIVPQALNKMLKKLGGDKVGEVEIDTRRPEDNAYYADLTEADTMRQQGFTVTPALAAQVNQGLPLFQSAQNKPARGWFDPKQLKAMLGSKSDITTFFHELAHYYLTVYSRVASDPQSPSQVREDMDAILSWFGIAGETPEQRLATWNAMTLEEQRPHHEAFAYNKEIYVSEGKSPSIEMQGVFERFSQFVKRIYISIRDDLNAIYKQEFGTDLPMMTGEIRRVMDRMIATDEQIRSAEERRNMENIFKDQELSGMDDAQWASYQQMRAEATQKSVSELNEQSLAATTWASRLKAKKIKEIEAEQEELRSEIRKQVKKEVESRNVYRAIKFLKYGILQTAGGEEVEFTGSNKLNTNAVKLMVPKENMDKFGSGKNGMVALDGYHPDIVSERFNYSSGDELILAILDAKPMDEVIDGITEDRMEIENGELNSPQAIEAAADKAVHNEARVKLVAVELRWLTKATQPVRAMIAAAKSVAKQMLETKRLRDIKPGDYASAAARAAKESQTAYFASQSAETAAKTAYTRHYNKMIAEGVEEAKAVEMATKVSDEALAKAESRSEAHKKKYGKMKPSEVAAQAKRSQLLQEQLALEANDAIDQVKKSLKYLRNVLSDKNVQKIGADNSDQIALLLERFELKNISLKEMDKRTSLADWIAGQLELGLEVDISKELVDQANKISYRNMTLSQFNDLVDAVKTIEYMGKNENAILTAAKKAVFKEKRDEIVKSIIENAGDRKASTRTPKSGTIGVVTNQVTRFIAAHLKAASVVRILDGGKDDGLLWNYLIRPANKSGDKETTMKATATEAASKILNPFFKSGRMGGKGKFFVSVNESLNREEKLVIALNMGNEGNIQRMLDGYGWTLEQVIPILESMTAEELNAVQEIWDLFGTYKSEISAMSRKIYGKDLDFIEPTPIQIKSASGETVSLRGGYYPAKYDPMASLAAENYEDAEKGKDLLRAAHISATTSRAYSKQRAEKVVDRPLIRNLSALYSGLNEVIHDLSWREWTIDANKLMRDKAFDKEIRERYGPAFKNQLKSWIKDVAAGEKGMDTDVDIALNFLRQGVSSAGLGFNLTSAALQVTGFNQSIIRVGPKYIGYGIMQVMKRGIGAFREVNELSEFMANRSRTQFRELNELRNRVQGQSAAMKRVRMGTYFLMMKMQRSVDVPTWIGAYAKQLEINPDEQLAIDIADQTVIDTQGGGQIKDLSAVERGGAGTKLFTVFYGYMNTVYNMAAVQTMTEKKRGKLAADYVMLFVVPVVLSYALKQLLKPKKDDDDEFDFVQLSKDLSIEQIQYLMGTMVVAREFSQIAKTMIDPSAPSMGYSGPAGLRMIGDTYTAATQFGQGEFDSAFRKSAINLIGDATGLPSAQVNRTIDGIEALMEDETTDIRAPLFGVRK